MLLHMAHELRRRIWRMFCENYNALYSADRLFRCKNREEIIIRALRSAKEKRQGETDSECSLCN